ncbi:MAG: hypothetical protein FRX49_13156 [Trebouxia sp. A1-2]|nr:MAG: hypothetical protein FRX49_13156 [Trebouxia sp. A1-2]
MPRYPFSIPAVSSTGHIPRHRLLTGYSQASLKQQTNQHCFFRTKLAPTSAFDTKHNNEGYSTDENCTSYSSLRHSTSRRRSSLFCLASSLLDAGLKRENAEDCIYLALRKDTWAGHHWTPDLNPQHPVGDCLQPQEKLLACQMPCGPGLFEETMLTQCLDALHPTTRRLWGRALDPRVNRRRGKQAAALSLQRAPQSVPGMADGNLNAIQ